MSNPNKPIASWEKHTKALGSKFLMKMGWKPGESLGSKRDRSFDDHSGIDDPEDNSRLKAPIEVKLRPKGMGLGYNDFKEQPGSYKKREIDLEDLEEVRESTQDLTERKAKKKMRKRRYLSAKEILLQEEEFVKSNIGFDKYLPSEESKTLDTVKIMDMRSPTGKLSPVLDLSTENLSLNELPEEEYSIRNLLYHAENLCSSLQTSLKDASRSHSKAKLTLDQINDEINTISEQLHGDNQSNWNRGLHGAVEFLDKMSSAVQDFKNDFDKASAIYQNSIASSFSEDHLEQSRKMSVNLMEVCGKKFESVDRIIALIDILPELNSSDDYKTILENNLNVKKNSNFYCEIALISAKSLISILVPKMKRSFEHWDLNSIAKGKFGEKKVERYVLVDKFPCFEDLLFGFDVIRDWDKVFANFNRKFVYQDDTSPTSPTLTESLIYHTWLPAIRRFILNSWKTKNQPKMLIGMLLTWMEYYERVVMTLIEHSVIPRIVAEIDSWDPKIEFARMQIDEEGNIQGEESFNLLESYKSQPLHTHQWLTPWLRIVPSLLEPSNNILAPSLPQTVRQKLMLSLDNWHPIDPKGYCLIKAWKPHLNWSLTSALLNTAVIPKLNHMMLNEFTVDPRDQRLDEFNAFMKWRDVIPSQDFNVILSNAFFQPWLQVLYIWLKNAASDPKVYEDVRKWYLEWKNFFPEDVMLARDKIVDKSGSSRKSLQNIAELIESKFKIGIDMMEYCLSREGDVTGFAGGKYDPSRK